VGKGPTQIRDARSFLLLLGRTGLPPRESLTTLTRLAPQTTRLRLKHLNKPRAPLAFARLLSLNACAVFFALVLTCWYSHVALLVRLLDDFS
jgi:hypothetical protein